MKGCLRVLAFFLLVAFGLGAIFYLFERWQRIGKEVVVIMRSSNEDCDEFRRIWKIDRVLRGDLNAKERASYCYLVNSQRAYSRRNKVEWIKVEGIFTNEVGQAYYTDCTGTLRFQDRTIRSIAVGKRKQR